MLDNLRRKSLSYSYSNPKHQIRFEQGHVIYKKLFSIGTHRTRYSEVEALKSFPNTFESVGKGFWIVFDMLGRVGLNMIACPSGTFIIGHDAQGDNKPRKETIERVFLLGETEVTQELYQAVMGINPSKFQNDSQNPVEKVSWGEAILFCNELSNLQGLDQCYTKNSNVEYDWLCDFDKNGYRLPTEKEWEYAAKAGTDNEWAGTNNKADLKKHAVYYGKSKIGNKKQTHPVKSKKPNEWGFYDMSGNVEEWCWDKYNPDNPDTSANRVARGGSWLGSASTLRSAYRPCYSPDTRYSSLGFRVCRSIVS